MSDSIQRYAETFRDVSGSLCGNTIPWIQATRKNAMAAFESTGFPGPRDEDWKYTKVSAIEKKTFRTLAKVSRATGPVIGEAFQIIGLQSHRLVFVDGCFQPSMSDVSQLPAGISLSPMDKMLTGGTESLRAHLSRYANVKSNGFCALNTAFMNTGAVLELPPNATLEHPVHLVFLSTGVNPDQAMHPRILVVAGAGASAQIVEHYIGEGEPGYLSNTVTELVLDENAALTHFKLQEESHKAFHISTLQVQQARNSRFVSHSISVGAQLSRHEINSNLAGPGASCELYGLYLARGRQHVDYHTRIDHEAPHCDSREFYKGIIDERGRGVFNGRVYVHPDAQKTNAQQANDNLLLSKDAEVDTKPQLEIFADDVKCSHGATVGQLDEDMVFYLRARGIEHAAARGLLTFGFASEVLDSMKVLAIKNYLEAKLLKWLPSGERIREIVS